MISNEGKQLLKNETLFATLCVSFARFAVKKRQKAGLLFGVFIAYATDGVKIFWVPAVLFKVLAEI